MKDRTVIFLLALVVTVMMYASSMIYVEQHEFTHTVIYDWYKIDSEQKVSLFLFGEVKPTNYTQWKENCDDFCRLAQLETEIVGYHTAILISTLWFIFVTYIGYKIFFANRLELGEKA